MDRLTRRFIGWLLSLANADPGVYRRDFYALKDRLLKKYGRVVGEDLQHILDECWGYEMGDGCEGKSCRRCGGTGIWRERWIRLERWELGGRTFHRPIGPGRPAMRGAAAIEGRVVHRPRNFHACRDATLWLYLLFDRPLFFRDLKSHRCGGWQWRPMLALQWLVFEASLWLSRRRCHCGRTFFARRNGWLICPACRRSTARPYFISEDLPF